MVLVEFFVQPVNNKHFNDKYYRPLSLAKQCHHVCHNFPVIYDIFFSELSSSSEYSDKAEWTAHPSSRIDLLKNWPALHPRPPTDNLWTTHEIYIHISVLYRATRKSTRSVLIIVLRDLTKKVFHFYFFQKKSVMISIFH